MRKLTTPEALHDRACDSVLHLGMDEPVTRVMDLLSTILKRNEWSLAMLCA